jgi:hypothetical protein
MIQLLIALTTFASAAALAQQQPHHHSASGHPPAPRTAPYAGEQSREIKALSAQEQAAWLDGQAQAWPRPPNSTASLARCMCWNMRPRWA